MDINNYSSNFSVNNLIKFQKILNKTYKYKKCNISQYMIQKNYKKHGII